MIRAALAVVAVAAVTVAFAADDRQPTAQQQRMVDCNKDAGADHLKGQERQEFMSKCLRGEKGGDRLTAQQEKMKTCNRTAGERDLKGDARQDFMRKCLSGDATAASRPSRKEIAEQKHDADKRDAEVRRDQLSSQQERMIACNKQARDKEMHGAVRKSFIRDCLKDDAAAGGTR